MGKATPFGRAVREQNRQFARLYSCVRDCSGRAMQWHEPTPRATSGAHGLALDMVSWRRTSAAIQFGRAMAFALLALCLLLLQAGCSGGGTVGQSAAAQTPILYTENKPFFLEDLEPEKQHTQHGRELKHLYEFKHTDPKNADLVIRKGWPLAIVVSGVRVPEDLPGGRRDLAVIIDVATSANGPLQSMVVFYQRDVPPGQMLNFQNLLIYSDPKWDPSVPPYFRLRIIDVRAERNDRMKSTLDQVSNLGASLSGLVPHPVLPIVNTAIEAARLILQNQANQTLLDYQIQFYSSDQVKAAGGADLAVFRTGTWLVVGRPRDTVWPPVEQRAYGPPPPDSSANPGHPGRYEPSFPSDVWRESLGVDRDTGQILRCTDGRVIFAPYVTVVVMSSDAQVPKFILDRCAELIQMLSSPSGKADLDGLDRAVRALLQSENAYKARRRIQRDESFADLESLVQSLEENASTTDPAKKIFSDQETLDLLAFVNQLLIEPDASPKRTVKELIEWWNSEGSTGRLVQDPKSRLGVAWRKKP